MKRFHVHLSVPNLADSIHFYSALFAAEPTVVKTDYAKWMLDDPRVNFAISQRGAAAGLDHLGVQVENDAELAEMHERLSDAALPSTNKRVRRVATRAPTSTGRWTRKALHGRRTRRSGTSRPMANPVMRSRPNRMPTLPLAVLLRAAIRPARP